MLVPSGTVTFLFTDIEASTRLAREHSEQWESLRARHHEILRTAIEQNHGFVFQIIGDAFCASFHKAADALRAAILAQQGLANEAWGETVIRVRMGIHTGEAEIDGTEYRGYLTMSMVQRLMSAGHGGQVLISGATENLLRGQLSTDIQLIDLGRHHFKDVPQPVRVFQLAAPGLQRDFPPVRTIDHHPNNLPTQLTSFVGREKERADIRRLLHNTHMLTLIGPGGTGKTRLSLQAAGEMLDQFPDGVWLVELAPVLDPVLVPRTTALTIGLRDEPQRPIIDMLCDYLHEKKLLILLDNCEHLVEACARMADRILHTASGILILASSREALGIGGEVTYRVPSLGVPDLSHLPSVETLDQYEAVRLFIDRATSADPAFVVTNASAPAVAQICHRLDGIPLAIELAAAKLSVLGVDQIAKRLDDRFKLLTGGSRTALERHQTLRAAIDWSYNLLPPDEQILFRRLSVFIGGWTLEAAESVCSEGAITGGDVLELMDHLIHKSLVFRDESRYHMLETIRQYANEKLVESGASNMLRDSHLEYFLSLAETAAPHLIRPEQLEWLAQLDADYENLRIALEWALGKEEAEPSLRLCAALGDFWSFRIYWKEGAQALAKALSKPVQEKDTERTARVKALYMDAMLAESLDDVERMEHSARSSLALAEPGSNELDTTIARFYVGFNLFRRNLYEEARPFLEQSFKDFERLAHPYWVATSHCWFGYILFGQGEKKQSEVFARTLELANKSGERSLIAGALLDQGFVYYLQARVEEAGQVVEHAGTLLSQIIPGLDLTINLRTKIAWLTGDTQKAKSLLLEHQEHMRLLEDKFLLGWALNDLGQLEMETGNLEQAEIYLREAVAIEQEISTPSGVAFCLVQLSILADIQGNTPGFKQTLKECLSQDRELSHLQKMHILTDMLASPFFQKPENSVPFLGALDLYYREIDRPISPLQKRYYDRAEATARAALGDAAFESVSAEGAKLSLDEALELMLQKVEKL